MFLAGKKLLWLSAASLLTFASMTGCEVKQADVDAAKEKAVDERKEVSTVVRENAQELYQKGRDASEAVAGQVREAAKAEDEAERLGRELARNKERDGFLARAKSRLEEVDLVISKRRLSIRELSESERSLAASDLALLEEKRKLLASAIGTAERGTVKDWSNHQPLVEQALQRLEGIAP